MTEPHRLEATAQHLAGTAQQPLRRYSTFDFGRARDENAFSVLLKPDLAEDILERIRATLPAGIIAFIGTSRWLGDEKHRNLVELVVANGDTPFDILRVARSDAINYDMETEDLVQRLCEFDQQCGIDIISAETDTIRFRLRHAPDNWTAFAQAIYDFCPDIVDQGCETVQALEQDIRASNEVYLWWD